MTRRPSVWDVLGDLDTFGQRWWDRAPFQRTVADFDPTSVISLVELDRLLASRHTDSRLFGRDGHVDPLDHREHGLRRADERTWLTNPAEVVQQFRAGATVMMPTAHEAWSPIGALAGQLEELLNTQVGATLFASPPGSLTDWHLDAGHVFVLHLFGTKHWLIQRDRADDQQTRMPFMATVHPGDVLYVPQGLLHRVSGTQAPAVHVSFYLSAPTWAELLGSAVVGRIDASSHPALQRSAHNPGWGTASRAQWTATLAELIDQLEGEIGELRRMVPSADFDVLAPGRARRPLGLGDQTGAFLDACGDPSDHDGVAGQRGPSVEPGSEPGGGP